MDVWRDGWSLTAFADDSRDNYYNEIEWNPVCAAKSVNLFRKGDALDRLLTPKCKNVQSPDLHLPTPDPTNRRVLYTAELGDGVRN